MGWDCFRDFKVLQKLEPLVSQSSKSLYCRGKHEVLNIWKEFLPNRFLDHCGITFGLLFEAPHLGEKYVVNGRLRRRIYGNFK